jgi:hypothetical protein
MPNGGERIYDGGPTFGAYYENDPQSRPSIQIARKNYHVSRLVCEAFHGSPLDDAPNALHRNENAHDNRSENLYWGTQRENLNAPGFLRYCRSRTGDDSPYVKGRRRSGNAA